jgi:hypothetical protein
MLSTVLAFYSKESFCLPKVSSSPSVYGSANVESTEANVFDYFKDEYALHHLKPKENSGLDVNVGKYRKCFEAIQGALTEYRNKDVQLNKERQVQVLNLLSKLEKLEKKIGSGSVAQKKEGRGGELFDF